MIKRRIILSNRNTQRQFGSRQNANKQKEEPGMKKLLAIVMCVLMMLSFAACTDQNGSGTDDEDTIRNTSDTTPTKDTGPSTPTENSGNNDSNEPSPAEYEAINRYAEIVKELSECEDASDVHYTLDGWGYSGSKALELYYQELMSLDSIDKWVGTIWTEDPSVNWNRQEILDRFVIVKDVALGESYTVTNSSGAKSIKKNYFSWEYQPNGAVSCMKWALYDEEDGYPIFVFDPLDYDPLQIISEYTDYAKLSYDENGRISQISIIGDVDDDDDSWYDPVKAQYALLLPAYDSNGNMTGAQVVTYSGGNDSITCTYDNNHRLTKIEDNDFVFTYSYDSSGNMVNMEYAVYTRRDGEHSVIVELYTEKTAAYTYDSENRLVSASITEALDRGKRITTYTYSHDESGRPLRATISYGNILSEDGELAGLSKISEIEVTRTYGDFYCYLWETD